MPALSTVIVLLTLVALPSLAIYCLKKNTVARRTRWLPPVLIIFTVGGLWFYEAKIIACPDCNIRPDIMIVWPIAIFVCALSIVAMIRDSRRKS